MKLLELKGLKSLRAMNAFHKLMLGLKMLPSYMNEDYDAFYLRIEGLPPADQRRIMKEAIDQVDLFPEEVLAIACFAADDNGVPYGESNLKPLNPKQIANILLEVSMQFWAIRLDFTTTDEKKK